MAPGKVQHRKIRGRLKKPSRSVDWTHKARKGPARRHPRCQPVVFALFASGTFRGLVNGRVCRTGENRWCVVSGKLHALAVTTATRSEALSELPTVDSFVPGYEASTWYGIGVPKNTPTEIVASSLSHKPSQEMGRFPSRMRGEHLEAVRETSDIVPSSSTRNAE